MIEFLWMAFATLVALAVVQGVRIEWRKLKRRMDEIEFYSDLTGDNVTALRGRIADLEAAERARKELTK